MPAILTEGTQDDDHQTVAETSLAGKMYPFKSLVPCDLRQFTRRYVHTRQVHVNFINCKYSRV